MTTLGRQIPNDDRKYYYLEDYLFSEVRSRFHKQGYLLAEDFFCIVIWKANRAKSKIAARLLSKGKERSANGEEPDLNKVVKDLTEELANKEDCKERLHCLLCSWELYLPTASAILTVLYPEEFTVFDKRVCDSDQLKEFHNLANRNFEGVWSGYKEFMNRVKEVLPEEPCLREKDRYLWGKSFHKQLECDIKRKFKRDSPCNDMGQGLERE